MLTGFVGVLYIEVIAAGAVAIWHWGVIPHVITGAVTGLAAYGYWMADSTEFSCATAAVRTVVGGIFGPVMATTAVGFDLNANLQTAAAAAGGVMGPRAIDTVATLAGKPSR